jgi:hypothetical protein
LEPAGFIAVLVETISMGLMVTKPPLGLVEQRRRQRDLDPVSWPAFHSPERHFVLRT